MIGRGIPVSAEALRIHRRSLVLDCHSHFLINGYLFRRKFHGLTPRPWFYNPFKNQLDLPSALQGGLNALAFTIYTPGRPFHGHTDLVCDRILDRYQAILDECAGKVVHCTGPGQIRAAAAQGRLATFLTMEGGHHLAGDVENVGHFHARGVRMLTLTHFVSNGLADGNTSPFRPLKGLSDFGRKVIREMENLGMMVDVAHCTDKALRHVLDMVTRPVIFSHAALRRYKPRFERNLSDDMARAIAGSGGLIGLIFFLRYLGRAGMTIRAVARHAADLAELCGAEHLCLGTDVDGFTYTPWGFRDMSDLPQFTQALLDVGFIEGEVRGILGENFLAWWEKLEAG